LALTDHDDISGLAEAKAAGMENAVCVINGVELSSVWEHKTIHVVGLFLDVESVTLNNALTDLKNARHRRGALIAEKFEKLGIHGALEGAQRFMTNERLISRAHFARFLVDAGYVGSQQKAFDRYLGEGKPAYVPSPWFTSENAVVTIRAAGGVAVLAHPGRYKLTGAGMRRLISEFRDCGGEAIEVFSPAHTPEDAERFIEFARYFGLKVSLGSDFHGARESRFDLGELPPLPVGVPPVWSLRQDLFFD
jgi:predicted metal-dependent phosphoesterase TrpH